MMKKNLLLSASVLVLAACSNHSQDVDLTEQNLDIQPRVNESLYTSSSDASSYDMAVGYEGIDASILDENTLQLRQDLAAITGNKILFDFDSSALNEGAQATLSSIANFVLANKQVTAIVIEGHTDERGTREYNLSLGERRAVAVKKYLVGLGLNASQIETISFGKEEPEDTAHSSSAWAKNRRAVILLDSK